MALDKWTCCYYDAFRYHIAKRSSPNSPVFSSPFLDDGNLLADYLNRQDERVAKLIEGMAKAMYALRGIYDIQANALRELSSIRQEFENLSKTSVPEIKFTPVPPDLLPPAQTESQA